jgi:hypothetical protein
MLPPPASPEKLLLELLAPWVTDLLVFPDEIPKSLMMVTILAVVIFIWVIALVCSGDKLPSIWVKRAASSAEFEPEEALMLFATLYRTTRIFAWSIVTARDVPSSLRIPSTVLVDWVGAVELAFLELAFEAQADNNITANRPFRIKPLNLVNIMYSPIFKFQSCRKATIGSNLATICAGI